MRLLKRLIINSIPSATCPLLLSSGSEEGCWWQWVNCVASDRFISGWRALCSSSCRGNCKSVTCLVQMRSGQTPGLRHNISSGRSYCSQARVTHQPPFRMNSFPKFLCVHFHSTLAHIQYMNAAIQTLQPHRYHETELRLEAHEQ